MSIIEIKPGQLWVLKEDKDDGKCLTLLILKELPKLPARDAYKEVNMFLCLTGTKKMIRVNHRTITEDYYLVEKQPT